MRKSALRLHTSPHSASANNVSTTWWSQLPPILFLANTYTRKYAAGFSFDPHSLQRTAKMLRLVQPQRLVRATNLTAAGSNVATQTAYSRNITSTRALTQQQSSTVSGLHEWTRTIQAHTMTMHDTADLNKARQLLLVLPNLSAASSSVTSSRRLIDKHTGEEALAAKPGSCMPLGSELVLFNPLLSETTLGTDGTERTFGPPGGLDQRMWASGSFEFEHGKQLKIGQEVQCEVVVESVQPKEGAKTGMMVLVTRKLSYTSPDGLAMTERRCHVYRKQRPADQRKYVPPPARETPKVSDGKYMRR